MPNVESPTRLVRVEQGMVNVTWGGNTNGLHYGATGPLMQPETRARSPKLMKVATATISDVESALDDYKAEAKDNPDREKLDAKKLAVAVNALTLQKNVAKDLRQAYNHAERKWSTNALKKEADGCTQDNKAAKVEEYIKVSPAYKRHFNDSKTQKRVERWMTEELPRLVAQ